MRKWLLCITGFILIFYSNTSMILNASEYNEEDELNSMNIEETMDSEQDEIEEEQEVSDAKDEELDDETDQVDTAIGTARGEIEFDYHKGMYKLDGSFSITNFASEQVTEPWIAFAVPENVLIAEDLPSGVEAVLDLCQYFGHK